MNRGDRTTDRGSESRARRDIRELDRRAGKVVVDDRSSSTDRRLAQEGMNRERKPGADAAAQRGERGELGRGLCFRGLHPGQSDQYAAAIADVENSLFETSEGT